MRIDALVTRARTAQRAVAGLTLDERLDLLARGRERLAERAEEIVSRQVAEVGTPRRFAHREVTSALALLDVIPELVEAIRPRPVAAASGSTTLEWPPLGVVFGWHAANSPVWVPTAVVGQGLAAGNAVVSRPSRRTRAVTGVVLTALAADWPPDAVVVCDEPPEIAEALVAHPGVHGVVAHASTATCRRHLARLGRAVAEGAPLRPYIPEASGNDALVVLAGADLDRAAAAAALAGFANGGQLCMAAKRIVVERACWEGFRERLVAHVEALVLGDPDHERTDVGPLPEGPARRQARAMLVEALAVGGRPVVGVGEDGPFFTPTVVELPADALDVGLWSEESFAPLRGLVVADDADHAARLAGDSRFGLGLAVFGPQAAALTVAARVRVARVMINADPLVLDPRLVVGGVGDSGLHGARPKIEQLVFARRVHLAPEAGPGD